MEDKILVKLINQAKRRGRKKVLDEIKKKWAKEYDNDDLCTDCYDKFYQIIEQLEGKENE